MNIATDSVTILAAPRRRSLGFFLWMGAIAWGVCLGAKVYDLLVIATSWGMAPPASLARAPYGPNYPVDPGDFFQPLTLVMAVGLIGALVAGWGSSPSFKRWLWLSVAAYVAVWAVTPTLFWPMIEELWAMATGEMATTEAAARALVRRWFVLDSGRVGIILAGFVGTVKALAMSLRSGSELR